MVTKSTSTVREMPQELFDSFNAQFDALTQAIEDAGFPVLHTCQILRGETYSETDSALCLSSMSTVRDLSGETVCRMAAVAAARPIMTCLLSILEDETGNIPAERFMQLIPLAKEVTDTFISYFTQAMASRTSQAIKESGCSGKEQAEVLMSALMSVVEN